MAWSQEIFVKLDDASHGTIVDAVGGTVVVTDDDSQGAGAPDAGHYELGKDRYVTILANCVSGGRYSFRVDELEVSCLDTVFVYDGSGTAGTLIAKFNSYTGNVHVGTRLYETPANTTGMVTIRFKTDPRTDTSRANLSCNSTTKGFKLTFECGVPCETVVPVIENKFYRTRNGVIYDSAYIHLITIVDTTYVVEDDPTSAIDHIDTNEFWGANLCIGDGVIFHGHGDYTYNYGYYTPSDATTYFRWDMGYENDTIVGNGVTEVQYGAYQTTGCYDVRLDLVDEFGCFNTVMTSIKVRTALNPIKTIFTLQEICNSDSLAVNMGYDGEDATLTLKRIETSDEISKTFEVRTFIPDGCNCGAVSYYEAPVEFTEFPNSRYVTSAKDICSLCINMEHSFLGDFFMTLVCPTGQEAIIKFGNKTNQAGCSYPDNSDVNALPTERRQGTDHGSGKNLGFPLDSGAGRFDSGSPDGSPVCDSLINPYGIGLDYCFSRDTHYTLVTGDNAKAVWNGYNLNPAGNFYIVSNGYMDNLTVAFPPVPYGFAHAGEVPHGTMSVTGGDTTYYINTKHPSNHEDKLDYYLPWTDFSELVGCPLNGVWKVRVYDTWGADNGWIFNWSLDICNVMPDDCEYQVGIDSLVWMPDPSPQYHDYDLGHYRGVKINAATPTLSYISSPDTAGTFRILVKVYDEFGCVWDTNTKITTYWTPEPNLGPDTSLCGVDKMLLNGSDRHAATENYSYVWSPFGQNTDTITTAEGAYGEVNYVVQVTNTRHGTACIRQDTILVGSRRQPLPSFIPTPFSFEGCEPLTLHFDNRSTDAVEHLWVFGDGITSSLASPTHTYAAGLYDLKYYATSADGCVDSIVSPQSIAVFTAPQAGFSWTPVYPSVLNPVATFNNLTEPKTAWTNYFWEIQYNIDNPLSVETLTDEYPTFDFSQWTDNDPSGNYAVRLIARTDNLAPSGNMVYCRDTAENSILVVNDFLQFPNVVSPNGDGINDRFVIQNLVNGMGYPINQLDIYNKWGTRVYHKENISRDEDFWDPKGLPTGTYFYRFSAKGYNGNIEHNGAIEVVR